DFFLFNTEELITDTEDWEGLSGSPIISEDGETTNLVAYLVAPKQGNSADEYIYINSDYRNQLEGNAEVDVNKWRCLNDAMWSEVDAVKVVAYRMLNQLKAEGWPNDLLEMTLPGR
ncbi:hypothetical protein ANCCEY_15208, partial [Ancylostoma ceylanicum]